MPSFPVFKIATLLSLYEMRKRNEYGPVSGLFYADREVTEKRSRIAFYHQKFRNGLWCSNERVDERMKMIWAMVRRHGCWPSEKPTSEAGEGRREGEKQERRRHRSGNGRAGDGGNSVRQAFAKGKLLAVLQDGGTSSRWSRCRTARCFTELPMPTTMIIAAPP